MTPPPRPGLLTAMNSRVVSLVLLLLLLALPARTQGAPEELDLWPANHPLRSGAKGNEVDISKPGEGLIAGKPIIRLGQVSHPTLKVFLPAPEKRNGTAILVCPGGAYNILALDLEGSEVCEWLAAHGVTAFLLKYRVPQPPGIDRHALPLEDAQRAIGLVRSRAAQWSVEPKKVGVLGFSAGGHLSAVLSHSPATGRSYARVDAADDSGCRPDFALLIYPAYLLVKDEERLAPELPVSAETPPTFLVITEDDPVRMEGALFYSLALKKAKVPCELHVFPRGGHGYGLRRTNLPVTRWPDLAIDWLRDRQWVK